MVELMTLQELADYLKVNVKTIYRLLEHDKVPSTRVGHQWRFDKKAIDNWLDQNSNSIKASLLVIDDDKEIGTLFKETLLYHGHKVETVEDPEQGLELVKERHYDLIFLDLMLPGIGGVEIFREIRSIKPELPVAIITGFPDSDLMMKALTNGPFSVMNKPFTSSDILTLVNNYLRFGMLTK
jgi:excisionase family DNA binding protein